MRAVRELLRPGGFLYLVDGHPFADLLGEQTRLGVQP
jgi:hypothetical protein